VQTLGIKELVTTVAAVQNDGTQRQNAFTELASRFQDMAFGCAYASVGDFHLAEDVAQEAFLAAYENLDQLKDPEAFPGWFRQIVLSKSNRQVRAKKPTVEADSPNTQALAASSPDPEAALETHQTQTLVHQAIAALPDHERLVTTHFYLTGYSQQEIAELLELPVTTVKKRLQRARQRLKGNMLDMVRDSFDQQRPSNDDRFVNALTLCQAAKEGDLHRVKQILAVEPDLFKALHPKHARQPIHYAARAGHAETVQYLLEAGANPIENIWYSRHSSALTLARERNHIAVVRVIEQWLATQHGTTSSGKHLSVEIRQQNLDEVRRLLDASPGLIHATDEAGNTPLHVAVETEQLELIIDLLDRGAPIDPKNAAAQRPIHLALSTSFYFRGTGRESVSSDKRHAIPGILLARGAAYDLWTASALGDTDRVNAILQENPEAADGMIWGALHGGHPDLVALCLERLSPLDEAGWFNLMDLASRMWRLTVPKNPGNAKPADFYACYELLLKHGVDPNSRFQEEETLLHRLSSNVWHLTEEDRMVFAGLLLDYGAQINALDSELKSTPLAWAVRYNWPNLVAYLLERGADPNLAGATWATPLAWTHKKDDVDIRQTLEKYGAQQ